MSSTRTFYNFKRTFYLANVCSGCNFPVIRVLDAEATSQAVSTISKKKSSQVQSIAMNAVNGWMTKIESLKNNKQIIFIDTKKNETLDIGLFCESSISGYKTECPYCGTKEPWQCESESDLEASIFAMNELEPMNFPTLFTDPKAVPIWINKRIEDIISRLEAQIDNNDFSTKDNLFRCLTNIKLLDEKMINLPEAMEKAITNEKINELRSKSSNIPFYKVFEKKKISNEIKDLEASASSLGRIINIKSRPSIKSYLLEKCKLFTFQSVIYGFDRIPVQKILGNATTTYLKANAIPDDMGSQIEKKDYSVSLPNENGSSIPESGIKYCKHCGFKLLPNSTFCSNCGYKV